MLKRLERNLPALSPEQQERLGRSCVAVVGCGGLGGWILEDLLRLGVGQIRAVDADIFEPSNGNRQLLCTAETLGQSKAEAAAARAGLIAPEAVVTAVPERLTRDNAGAILDGADLVLDAVDSAETRLVLEDACARLGLWLIHGAVSGWSYQAAAVPPGSGMLHLLYAERGTPQRVSTLAFVPAACAAVQAAEAVKLLTGQESDLRGKLLVCDLRSMETEVLPLQTEAEETAGNGG